MQSRVPECWFGSQFTRLNLYEHTRRLRWMGGVGEHHVLLGAFDRHVIISFSPWCFLGRTGPAHVACLQPSVQMPQVQTKCTACLGGVASL